MKIKIIHPDGSAPATPNVVLSNAATHIAANDQWAHEAQILMDYSNGNWDHWTEVDCGGDWAEYEYDHEAAKNSIHRSAWETVIEVQIAECNGYWYARTIGVDDEFDATPYDSHSAVVDAAKAFAENKNENR